MNDIQFSVLMSVYIKENPEYLKKSIESVINQTKRPDQIVLVCDGLLTAQLDEVIESFQKRYSTIFDVIRYAENKGLGKALNIGLKACKFDYIARMDTDDIARNDRFEIQTNEFANHPNLMICGGHVEEFNEIPGDMNIKKEVPLTYEEIRKYVKNRNPFNHMTVMFNKNAILDLGGYIDFYLHEDYYLWARALMKQYECVNVDKVLVDARVGNGMYERRGGIKYVKTEYKLQKEFYKIGLINKSTMTFNLLSKSLIRVIPNFLRKQIYLHFLRK